MPSMLKSALALVFWMAMTAQVSSQLYELPASCNNKYKRTDLIGTLISGVINMHGVNHCATMCAGFYGCTCYSYDTVGRICYLRYGCNTPAVNAIFSSGECTDTQASPQYSLPSTCNNNYPRTDYIGTLMASVVNMHSKEQCAFICSTFHGCTCYSYDTVARICYLRYGCNTKAVNIYFTGGDCFEPSEVAENLLPVAGAAALGKPAVESHTNGWLVASLSATVCCVVVIAACVVLKRRKQADWEPIVSETTPIV